MRTIHTIVIHCSATPEGRAVSVDTIRKWHLDRGWRDIGYHFVIDLEGNVHKGRPIGLVGAHVAGHNTGAIGVCYVGGVTNDGRLDPKDTRTPAQREALASLVAELAETYPGIRSVRGHRDFPGVAKACPCFDAGPEYQPVVDMVRKGGKPVPARTPATADAIKPAFPQERDMGGKKLTSTTNLSACAGFATTAATALAGLETWLAALIIVVAAGFAAWIIRERLRQARELGV
ncbi:N-acetylmuramoyl-L-alanine amidase [Stappia sp. ICDLI1TA098]